MMSGKKTGPNTLFQRLFAALVAAFAISFALHIVFFAMGVFVRDQSSVLMRAASAIMTPAGWLVERYAPGHDFNQIVYMFVISTLLYTVAFWPITAIVTLLRKSEVGSK